MIAEPIVLLLTIVLFVTDVSVDVVPIEVVGGGVGEGVGGLTHFCLVESKTNGVSHEHESFRHFDVGPWHVAELQTAGSGAHIPFPNVVPAGQTHLN